MKSISTNRIPMSLCLLLWLAFPLKMLAWQTVANEWKQYESPSEAGFSESKLEAAHQKFKEMGSAAFMVVHQGKVVAAWGDVSRRYLSHSMRKSLMSAMYGIYEGEGRINMERTLKELGIDDIQGLTAEEKEATVLDLITARSGIYHPAAYEPRSMKSNRPQRGVSKPGEQFNYNNWDFNTLLTILEQEAGIKFFDAFYNRIASPLGMEDLRFSDMRYRFEPELSEHAAYLFKMSTRDLARFGQLYLNKGKWNGRQIVPADWVEKSTSVFSSDLGRFSNRGGYGYLWWVDHKSFNQPMYYASGLGGHKLLVLPEADLVIVHRVNSYLNMGVRDQDVNTLVGIILEAKISEVSTKPKLKVLSTNRGQHNPVQVSESELRVYEGKYKHSFFGKMQAYVEDGWLKMKGEVLGNFRLYPKGNGRFIIEDLPELPLSFLPADQAHVKGQSITRTDERRRPQAFIMYY